MINHSIKNVYDKYLLKNVQDQENQENLNNSFVYIERTIFVTKFFM